MAKKQQNSVSQNHKLSEHELLMGIITILAIVSMVAMISLVGNNIATSSELKTVDRSVFPSNNNVVGQASVALVDKSQKNAQLSAKEKSLISSVNDLLKNIKPGKDEILSEPEIDNQQIIQREYNIPTTFYSPPIQDMVGSNCTQINQSYFPPGANITIDKPNGCVELTEDINIDGILTVAGDFTFDCKNHEIIGDASPGFIIKDSSIVKNCVVKNREWEGFLMLDRSVCENCKGYGSRFNFRLYDKSKAINSQTKDGGFGFYLHQIAEVHNGYVDDALHNCYHLTDDNLVTNSFATKCGNGFLIAGSSKVYNSIAKDTIIGFRLTKEGYVENSISNNNRQGGFKISISSIVNNSHADNNTVYGLSVNQKGLITSSTATNNRLGIIVGQTAVAIDSVSNNNKEIGFRVGGDARVFSSSASGNEYGFEVLQTANVETSVANKNKVGFILDYNAIVSESISKNNEVGYVLRQSSSLRNSISNFNSDIGILITDISKVFDVASDKNGNVGVFVKEGASLLNGYRVCDNGEFDIYVTGGTVMGTFRSSPIEGFGDIGSAIIQPC